jgi:hypothetical protein
MKLCRRAMSLEKKIGLVHSFALEHRGEMKSLVTISFVVMEKGRNKNESI